jgi:hypothetical protein
MRPISHSRTEPISYEQEVINMTKLWESEISDTVAKIKGSSLKPEDKTKILNKIQLDIAKSISI